MHPVTVLFGSPLNIVLPQTLSILICIVLFYFASLDAATIRCCDGDSPESALVAIAAITPLYHAIVMLAECYICLWADETFVRKKGIPFSTMYSHLTFIILTPFVWTYWVILLPLHITTYKGLLHVEGQHYYIPMLVLEGLEIGVFTWLWSWSLVERLKAKKLAQ